MGGLYPPTVPDETGLTPVDLSAPLGEEATVAWLLDQAVPGWEDQRARLAARAVQVRETGRIALLGAGGRCQAALVRPSRAATLGGWAEPVPATRARTHLAELLGRVVAGERIPIRHRSHGTVAVAVPLPELWRMDPPLAAGELPEGD